MKTRLGQRAAALLAAVLLQAGLVTAIVFGFRVAERARPVEEFVTALLWLPPKVQTVAPVPKSPVARPRQRVPQSMSVSQVAAPTADASGVAGSPPASVDWWREADLEVARTAEDLGRFIPPTQGRPQAITPAHRAGESYVDGSGNRIVWLSARCYMISEAPQLGTSAILANAQPTRTSCLGAPYSRSDLFKDTAAFRRRHPEPAP